MYHRVPFLYRQQRQPPPGLPPVEVHPWGSADRLRAGLILPMVPGHSLCLNHGRFSGLDSISRAFRATNKAELSTRNLEGEGKGRAVGGNARSSGAEAAAPQ